MKKYYYWSEDWHYLHFECDYPEGFDQILEKIDQGERIADLWRDFPFKMQEKKKRISDFPYLSRLKPISERALNCLHDILAPYVEIFPLKIVNSDLKYYGINVLNIYDIDVQRSDVSGCWLTKEEGKAFLIFGIDVVAFPNDKLPDVPIFRLKYNQDAKIHLTGIIISSELHELIEKNNLVGLTFKRTLDYRTGGGEGKRIDSSEINKTASPTPPRKTYKIRKTKSSLEFKHYPVEAIGPPVTEKILVEFEKNLPRALPHDYREFLKQCNGGSMDEKNNAVYVQGIPGFTETKPGDEWAVAWFTPLEPDKKESWELSQHYQFFQGEGFFPDYCLRLVRITAVT